MPRDITSLYQREKGGSYYINYTFKKKRHRRSLKTVNINKAREIEREVRDSIENHVEPAIEDIIDDANSQQSKYIKVSDFFEKVEELIVTNASHAPRYKRRRLDYLNNFRKFCQSKKIKYLAQIKPQFVDQYIKSQLELVM